MKSAVRSPALHFLLIGGLLFAARSWQHPLAPPGGSRAAESRAIVVSAAQIVQLRREWMAQIGRAPTPIEERALVDKAIDEEILFREALARGFDRDDAVVRRRLIELARFVADDADRDEEALYREALKLGLDRSDLVIRRHLVQTMRLFARQPAAPKPITDAELQELLEREADRFRMPATVTLTHVYLSESRRGASLQSDADALLAKLRSERIAPAAAPAFGDPFPVGYRLSRRADRDLQKTFGASFAAAIAPLKVGEWAGPIRSSSGMHLVWVDERFPARMPPLESVRTQLLERLREERGEERLGKRLAELRAEYSIRVEDAGPVDLALDRPAAEPPGLQVPSPPRQVFLGD